MPKHAVHSDPPKQRSDEIARAAADASARMYDQLLATTCHELRTPLTAILLWARILRGPGVDEATRQEAVATIERSARSQAEMLEDLLDESRLLAGKVRLNIRAMELTAAAAAAVKTAQILADAKGITLETDFDGQCGSVHADPVRIQQVIWNLLANALRFTPCQGRVALTLRRMDECVRIRVADSGQGIAATPLPHVFDGVPSSSAAASRRSAGQGFGLAIARQLVQLHGGTITAHSAGEGKGATFTVDLPLRPAAGESARGGILGSGFTPSELLRDSRILLVEDQADTRNVIRWLLEQSGAQVSAVESAAAAMELLQLKNEQRPTALVSDIGMPGEDGFDLIRKIRAWEPNHAHGKPMPAIAITAYASDAERRRALRLGFNAFMPKPIDPGELIAWLAETTSPPK